jgi:hypothetical protein
MKKAIISRGILATKYIHILTASSKNFIRFISEDP